MGKKEDAALQEQAQIVAFESVLGILLGMVRDFSQQGMSPETAADYITDRFKQVLLAKVARGEHNSAPVLYLRRMRRGGAGGTRDV